MKRIAIISTGGTIEKTYDEHDGTLENRSSVLDVMLKRLVLRGVTITTRVPLMNKDSLQMDDADHARIAATAGTEAARHDGVLVIHGTDRLAVSGEKILADNPDLPCPVILVGAMRPFEVQSTDALQNLTEALLAVQLVSPGVYVAMHNQVLKFPGVVKDKSRGCFVHTPTP